MSNRRNDVEKALVEVAEQVKQILNQRLYVALAEAKVERQAALKLVGLSNVAVDEATAKYSKHFSRALDEFEKAVKEDSLAKVKSA